jgi:endonuclease YncB( thermonuclease family)
MLPIIAVLVATPALAQVPDAYYEIQGPARIVDADTLDIDGQRVRIWGVDALERSQNCTDADGAAWACGQRASNVASEFIGARTVKCHARDRDRYGRIVGQCFVGSVDYGEWLVSNGMALAYRRYSAVYVGAEQSAKNRRAGVWAGTFEAPWDYRHRQRD